jgi:hypothetical protein
LISYHEQYPLEGYRTLKSECVRPGTRLTVDDATRLIVGYVRRYSHARLYQSLGHRTPAADDAMPVPGDLRLSLPARGG